MNSITTSAFETPLALDIRPPSAFRILRLERDRVAETASTVRNLLDCLETLQDALSSKIRSGAYDEGKMKEVEGLQEEYAHSFAHGVVSEMYDTLLRDAFAAGVLQDAIAALKYDGTMQSLHDAWSGCSDGEFGLDGLVPSSCYRAIDDFRGERFAPRAD